MSDERLQVVFMPWAGLTKPVSIGPVMFWPWHTEAETMVPDVGIRGHLESVLGSYVGYGGTSVDTLTVCAHGLTDFRPLKETEAEGIRRARSALFFASFCQQAVKAICSGAHDVAPPTADVFAVVTRKFALGSTKIAVSTRSLTILAPKFADIKFQRPFALGGGPCEADPDLVEGFDRVASGKLPKKWQHRLFAALEWFRLAHIEEGEVSETSRVVMMATAFEVLLQAYGKKQLGCAVDDRTAQCGLRRTWRMDKGKKKPLPCSAAAAWLWDFYDLRSAIVHGDYVPPRRLLYSGRITHLNAAEMLFWALVRLELVKHGCGSERIREAARKFSRVFKGKTAKDWVGCLAQIEPLQGEVWKALGWSKRRTGSRI